MERKEIFQRTELLVGGEGMARLEGLRVIVFGVGGVGSWCAESLARSGVGHLTIVDKDCVAASNINRQLMAVSSSVGRPKVEVLGERLLDINPGLDLRSVFGLYTAETQGDYALDDYDYVVDAIDSLPDKALLIMNACRSRAVLLSSMGAALRMDMGRVQVAEFWKVKGCPLARALRTRFKKDGAGPSRKFKCVFSDEPPCAPATAGGNGSMMHVTAAFGLRLAQLVISGE